MRSQVGNFGPNPDALERLATARSAHLQDGLSVDVRDLQILRQRSLHNLRRRVSDDSGDTVDVSVGLALLEGVRHGRVRIGSRELILFELIRSGDKDWTIGAMAGSPLPNPPDKPWTGMIQTGLGISLAYGAAVHSSEVSKVRIELADGTVAEDVVLNGCLLLYLRFTSPDAWAAPALIQLYDRDGREVTAAQTQVSPAISTAI